VDVCFASGVDYSDLPELFLSVLRQGFFQRLSRGVVFEEREYYFTKPGVCVALRGHGAYAGLCVRHHGTHCDEFRRHGYAYVDAVACHYGEGHIDL